MLEKGLHSGIDLVADKIGECLHCQLQRSLTSNQNPSFDGSQLLTSNERTDSSTAREANTAEYSLIEHLNVLDVLEARARNTIGRSTSLSNDKITITEVSTDRLPDD